MVLFAGLQPRGSYKDNWLSWNASEERTVFKEYGMAYGDFPSTQGHSDGADGLLLQLTLKLFLKENDGLYRIITHIGDEFDPNPIVLGQWRNYLILRQGLDSKSRTQNNRFSVDITEHINQSINVEIQLHANENRLSINGVMIQQHNPSEYLLDKISNNIAIGNIPNGNRGWAGEISAFKVYRINQQYQPTDLLLDYAFNQRFTQIIKDLSNHNAHLTIPKPGLFPELEILHIVPLKELLHQNPSDVIVNLLGFIPLGCATAFAIFCFTGRNSYHLLIGGFATCSFVSLLIELSQALIPSRFSHLHDLILNISGGFLGVLACSLVLLMVPHLHRDNVK